MYIKLENGKISQLMSVYTEESKLFFVLYDGSTVVKQYSSLEVVGFKMSNIETSIAGKAQLLDLNHL